MKFKPETIDTQNKQETLKIYSQNVSGCKRKITAINDKLATATFDIYCVQESWFDASIQNSEVTPMTQYSI